MRNFHNKRNIQKSSEKSKEKNPIDLIMLSDFEIKNPKIVMKPNIKYDLKSL